MNSDSFKELLENASRVQKLASTLGLTKQQPKRESPSRFAFFITDLDLSEHTYSLFETGHYAQAVFEGCKYLINKVKDKSRVLDQKETSMMTYVFSKNNPVLRINDLKTDTDRNEQEGYMHLFAGVALAIRNPRGHENIFDDHYEALLMLMLINHLSQIVDISKKVRKRKAKAKKT